jgi:hypothetical protein
MTHPDRPCRSGHFQFRPQTIPSSLIHTAGAAPADRDLVDVAPADVRAISEYFFAGAEDRRITI